MNTLSYGHPQHWCKSGVLDHVWNSSSHFQDLVHFSSPNLFTFVAEEYNFSSTMRGLLIIRRFGRALLAISQVLLCEDRLDTCGMDSRQSHALDLVYQRAYPVDLAQSAVIHPNSLATKKSSCILGYKNVIM
jgi:hypothetical protein